MGDWELEAKKLKTGSLGSCNWVRKRASMRRRPHTAILANAAAAAAAAALIGIH